MKDVGQELVDLKREVLESRNQVIRTDNQLKNVALDVRGFDRRFEALEKRTRMTGLGVQVLTALTVAMAAYVAYAARVSSLEHQLTEARAEVGSVRAAGESQAQALRAQMSKLEQTAEKRAHAEAVATEFLSHLDRKRDKEATALLAQLELGDLAPIGRASVEKLVLELRRRSSETSYRTARTLQAAGKGEAAVDELRRALAIDPDGRYAMQSSYLLASQLWDLKRYDEVVPIARKLLASVTDKALADELRFLLATSLAHSAAGKDEALAIIGEAQRTGSRYATVLKNLQTALEQGGEIPASSGGRATPRPARRADVPSNGASAKPPPEPQP
ncbi:MAG: hypothetical protein AAB426_14770 [Myxococcota bacterium]